MRWLLVTGVVISPWAEEYAVEEIKLWVQTKGFPDSARGSELPPNRPPSVPSEVVEKASVTKEELDRLRAELSGLTPDRVRFLYRQRWEACRWNPGGRPRVTDIQYLETTLRVLDELEGSRN